MAEAGSSRPVAARAPPRQTRALAVSVFRLERIASPVAVHCQRTRGGHPHHTKKRKKQGPYPRVRESTNPLIKRNSPPTPP